MKWIRTASLTLSIVSCALCTHAADFSQDNFLIANGGIVYEYTPTGTYVGQVTQDLRINGSGTSRGIAIDGFNGIHVWSGQIFGSDTFYLASVANGTTLPTYQSITGHDQLGNITYGDIASDGLYVYAPDGDFLSSPSGIIRYSILDPGNPVRFLEHLQPTDISFGYDGLLYAQNGSNTVFVIDPLTMEQIRTVPLNGPSLRDMEVRSDGHIFAIFEDVLRHYSPEGDLLAQLSLDDSPGGTSMAMSPDGTIILGSSGFTITVTDTSLSGYVDIATPNSAEQTFGNFIAFGSPTYVRQLGDLTGDQHVGFDDLDLLLANWGNTVTAGTGGDLDGSGVIDDGDLQQVIANWGDGTPPDINIPEPGTAGLLAAMGLLVARRRR